MEILMNGKETGQTGILLYAIVIAPFLYPSKRERERKSIPLIRLRNPHGKSNEWKGDWSDRYTFVRYSYCPLFHSLSL